MDVKNKQVKKDSPVQKHSSSVRKWFVAGVTIVIVSIFLGWPAVGVCVVLTRWYGNLWFIIGGGIYAISWVLLGIGTLMAGPGGVKYAKMLIKRIFVKDNKTKTS